MAAEGHQAFSISWCIRAIALWLLLSYGHCFEMACIEVKRAFTEKGLDGDQVPLRPVTGKTVEVVTSRYYLTEAATSFVC